MGCWIKCVDRFNLSSSSSLSFPISPEDLHKIQNSNIRCKNPREIPINDLEGVGINSEVLWSAASRQDYRFGDRVIEHFKPIEEFEFSHVVLVSCVDWLTEKRCKNPFQNKQGIIETTRQVLDQTNLHVTLSFKGYEQRKKNGKDLSTFQELLEREKSVQDAFVNQWKEFAEIFKSYSRERLSFALPNEPEFQFPAPTAAKRKKWESIAGRAIEAIRSVSPERVIIYEGIAKSKFNERWKKNGKYKYILSDLMRPLPFGDIVYGVHSYEPAKFLDQTIKKVGYFGKPYSKRYSEMVRRVGQRLAKWSIQFNVPVSVTETGWTSYVRGVEGPSGPEECVKYAADAYKYYVEQGIPVVWWAIEKERTIYLREESDYGPDKLKCDFWMPRAKKPDPHLFKALKLTMGG